MAKRKSKSKFADRLAGMNDTYNEQKDSASGISDGVFRFQLQGCELKEAASGNMMVRWEHLCLDDEAEGVTVFDQNTMSAPRSYFFLAQRIRNLGFEAPEDICDIESLLEEIQNAAPIYTAEVKNKDGFTNVRIQELDDEVYTAGKDDDDDESEEEEEEEETEPEKNESEILDDAEEPEEDPEEEEEEGEDENFEMAKELVIAQGYEVEEESTMEDFIETLNEEKLEADNLTKDEIVLLKEIGVKFKASAKKKVTRKSATTAKSKPKRKKK